MEIVLINAKVQQSMIVSVDLPHCNIVIQIKDVKIQWLLQVIVWKYVQPIYKIIVHVDKFNLTIVIVRNIV